MPSYPHQSAGNRGADVRAIQGFLRHHGTTDLRITGIYDPPTVAAVRAFQTAQGLPVTGMVNGPTWARFLVWLRPGDSGEAVAVAPAPAQREAPGHAHRRRCLRRRDRDRGRRRSSATRACRSPASSKATTWRYLISHFERPSFGRWLCDYQVGNGLADWGTGGSDRPDRGGGRPGRARGPRPGRDRRHRLRARRRHPRSRKPRARPRCRCAADAARREPMPLGRQLSVGGLRPCGDPRPRSGRSGPPRRVTSSSSTSTTPSSSARADRAGIPATTTTSTSATASGSTRVAAYDC